MNRRAMPTACVTVKATPKNPTQDAPHSIFLDTQKNFQYGAIVTESSLDTELHIETTTIMFADVVESVRLIEQDEKGNVSRIRALLTDLHREAETVHGGKVLERRGDGLLVKFGDARAAVACAHEMHRCAKSESAARTGSDAIVFRIGIHSADVLTDSMALYGSGINHAARITSLAVPGGTVVSAGVRDLLTDGLDADISDMGECYLRNVEGVIRAYRIQTVPTKSENWPQAPLQVNLSVPDDLRLTLAVLPIASEAVSSGSQHRYNAGDVLTDQIISVLSRSASVNVISQFSANAYRGRATTTQDVTQRLKTDYVVSGTYLQSGQRLSVRIEVSQSRSEQVLWVDEFGGSENDVVSSESDLVGRIVSGIADAVMGHEMAGARILPLPNLSNHTLYLAAISMLHRFSRSEFQKSREMLEGLRERAPRHPAPLAWLSRWHLFNLVQGWSTKPAEDCNQAIGLSKRALDLDPKSALALTIAGGASVGVVHDVAAAQHYYDEAIVHNPNESLAWLLKGVSHGLMGQSSDALVASERATRLTPLDPMKFYYDSLCASAAAGAGEYKLAVILGERAVRANCMHGSAFRALAIAKGMLGDMDGARAVVQQLLQIEPATSLEVFSARAITANERHEAFAQVLLNAGLPEKSPTAINAR
jgi:adenylate cyclase